MRARREASALESLAGLSPEAYFDFQFNEKAGIYDSDISEPPGAQYLKRIFGDNFFCHVESLEVTKCFDEVEPKVAARIGDFRQLKQLTIQGSVGGLAFLEKLQDLEELNLDCHGLIPNDIEPLTELKKLKGLSVKGLADLGDLSKLTTLERLTIESSMDTDIEALVELQNLKVLKISDCEFLLDLNPIGKLSKLECFELATSGFKDYKVIGTLPRLKKLNIGHPLAGFEEWNWLGGIQALEELDLSSSRIDKFPSLKKFQTCEYSM